MNKQQITNLILSIGQAKGPQFLRLILVYLAEKAEGKEGVCFTIRPGGGYDFGELRAASKATSLFDQMDKVLADMGSRFIFTGKFGFFDRNGNFQEDNVHYTIWLSEEEYSTSAQDVSVSRELVAAPAFV